MNEGINVTLTRKLMNFTKRHNALQYLYDEVIPECIARLPELEGLCKVFDYLDTRGLFTRVILAEMRDFGVRIEQRYPDESHKTEAKEFVDYVYTVANRSTGEELQELGHLSTHISTAFVLIGTYETMSAGATRYLNHIKRLKLEGYSKAYLAARGGAINDRQQDRDRNACIRMAERVGYLSEKGGLGKLGRTMKYYAEDSNRVNRLHILIELSLN
jgi:hypothetical protein